ncbi:hypothetical protein EVAR_26951_1 [Eumeta japonica]|uniref:Uncharacterized protein n=1 Tax=Eumeta variegata TaxID=151549 RepID=A0A4C1VN21_EUMVA|nr:hypothetical protein EVAR_26951_1 [Eumeta japonica]
MLFILISLQEFYDPGRSLPLVAPAPAAKSSRVDVRAPDANSETKFSQIRQINDLSFILIVGESATIATPAGRLRHPARAQSGHDVNLE